MVGRLGYRPTFGGRVAVSDKAIYIYICNKVRLHDVLLFIIEETDEIRKGLRVFGLGSSPLLRLSSVNSHHLSRQYNAAQCNLFGGGARARAPALSVTSSPRRRCRESGSRTRGPAG